MRLLRLVRLVAILVMVTPLPGVGDSPCESGRDCVTGFCSDGVCCESACDEGRCDILGFEGLCIPDTQSEPCAIDCDGDFPSSMDDLVTAVAIAMGTRPIEDCAPYDRDRNGRLSVAELVEVVVAALGDCD